MRYWIILVAFWVLPFAHAQTEDLSAEYYQLSTQLDAFGLETQVLIGEITNHGEDAYSNITVYADIYNADDELIGEGFGYTVNQCGNALLDTSLQPERTQRFLATVDLFIDDPIDYFDIFIDATPTEVAAIESLDYDGVTQISDREVVAFEWQENGDFLYGVGCDSRVFTSYQWYSYADGIINDLAAHPNERFVTDAFLRQTGINRLTQGGDTDLTLYDRSYLTFPTVSRRVVYQNDIHTIITSETDGSFGRVIHSNLSRNSLQGFVWSPLGNFAAYYFGAYGEPVYYFTAGPTNGLISAFLQTNTPSATVPGLYNDGRRVVISGNFDDTRGYYLSNTATQNRQLLFEVDELAGNNYPAPAYYRRDNSSRYLYIIRPIDGQATLQCHHIEGDETYTLTELPLQLDIDERAWSWLSPDFNTLAVAANGRNGGLWLVDLTSFEDCR